MARNFAIILALIISLGGILICAEPSDGTSIKAAHDWFAVFYPKKILAENATNAYLSRGAPQKFVDLGQVMIATSNAINCPHGPPRVLEMPIGWVTDSLLLNQTADRDFTKQIRIALPALFVDLKNASDWVDATHLLPFRKALLQRQVVQFQHILYAARQCATDGDMHGELIKAMQGLERLKAHVALTDGECKELESNHPELRLADGNNFSTSPWNLVGNYMPSILLQPDGSWFEFPSGAKAGTHFRKFGGRSFVHLYLRAPGWTQEDIGKYWFALYRKFGEGLTRSGSADPLPAGSETVLVRTSGIFLADGRYADSFIPEEILVRAFRAAKSALDLSSSDYRGTYIYQYKLAADPWSNSARAIELKRIKDDDAAFFGFYSDVPDYAETSDAVVTTMRNNCISYHSELHYGVNTVFSLAAKPPDEMPNGLLADGMLESTASENRYVLHQKVATFIVGLTK